MTDKLPPLPSAGHKQWRLPNTRDAYAVPWYSASQMEDYARQAVREYKAEIFKQYEANTEQATEAEGEAFTHGYLCADFENKAVREAVPEVRKPIEYDASKEHPAVNDFAHWLNARRDLPVAEAFHDIVQCYRSLHSRYIAAAKEANPHSKYGGAEMQAMILNRLVEKDAKETSK